MRSSGRGGLPEPPFWLSFVFYETNNCFSSVSPLCLTTTGFQWKIWQWWEAAAAEKKPKFPLTVKCPAAAERTAFWSEDIWSKHLVTSAYWPVRDIFKPLVQNQLQKLILIRFVSSLVQTSFLIACSLLVWGLTNSLWHTQRCFFSEIEVFNQVEIC